MIKTTTLLRYPLVSIDSGVDSATEAIHRKPRSRIYEFHEEVYLILEAMEQDQLKFETLLRFEVRPTSNIAEE